LLKNLSIILLAYNEQESIKKDIIYLNKYIKSKIKMCEIIIVEDFSSDNTYKILKNISKKISIKILRGSKRLGYRNSLVKGIKSSKYENIFFTESGRKYNFSEFANFSSDYNSRLIFSGYRSPRKDQLSRRFLTYSMNLFVRIMFGTKTYDLDSGYKLLSKKKFFHYYIKKQKYKDFGSCLMLIKMCLNKEKIIEKKISYNQRIDKSKQFNSFKIIKKSIYLAVQLIKLKINYDNN
jgi:glycosyltransferase involved in cell wall biosynthesis